MDTRHPDADLALIPVPFPDAGRDVKVLMVDPRSSQYFTHLKLLP